MRAHPECRDDVHTIFKDSYLEYDFILSGPLSADEKTAIQELRDDKLVHVANINALEDILDIFGSDIYSFIVDFQEIDVNDGKEIVEYINDECFENLEKFYLINCKGNVLDRLKNEFKYMSEVKFSSSASEDLVFDIDGHTMQNIFPTLHTLRVDYSTPSDWTFIKGKYEKLQILEVHLPQTIRNDTINGWHISSLFMNNKKIIDLTIVHPTLKLLKVVHEKLRRLEDLHMIGLSNNYSDILNQPFQFRPLKHLILHPNHEHEIPWKISFPKLDEFTLKTEHNLTSEWMEFISKQIDSNLGELRLKTQGLEREYFASIPGIFSGLKDVIISCQSRFTADDVLNFMEETKQLTSFKLEICIDELECTRLFEQLDKMWTSKRYNRSEYQGTVAMSFQR